MKIYPKGIAILIMAILINLSLKAQKFELSQNPVVKIGEGIEYKFGYLEVPESRSDSSKETVQLPVYIFKSRNPQPKKDPVIYTVGGPGSSTMPSAQYSKFYPYLEDRDLIFFEQRGNYFAKPHLGCPEWAEAQKLASSKLSLTEKDKNELFVKAASDCKQRLKGKGINLDAYNTKEIAADIEDLRIALGIEKWNLLTISYSTKIAQVLMRDYPEGIRSVVMDSPLPLEADYDVESTQNKIEVLNALLTQCQNDAACNTEYPELKRRLYDFLGTLAVEPIILKVKTDSGKKSIEFDGADFLSMASSLSQNELPYLPLFIDEMLSGDYKRIKDYIASSIGNSGDGTGIGMRLSVWCSEETAFVTEQDILNSKKDIPIFPNAKSMVFSFDVCKTWDVSPAKSLENESVKSDIPTLIVSGEFDTETPLGNANMLHGNLENSFQLIFQGYKHTPTTFWSNPCAANMANAFFNKPEERPRAECFENIKPISFK